jgi:hypothetical protein
MILHPWNNAEEIDRRLSALNDPELAELLKSLNRDFSGGGGESYTSDDAPFWRKRIALVALAGLLAMSAGYSYFGATSHPNARAKHHSAAVVPPRRHPKAAPRHVAVTHHAPVVARHVVPSVPVYRTPAVAPDESAIRQARAQLLHERALELQARAEAARAHHQAQLAMQAQAQAQAHAQAQAVAQARAEALAQARAEALQRAQAESAAETQAQDQALQNASDPQTKPGQVPPPSSGRISTYPRPSAPAPVPGPVIDPNCTPHRGSLFTQVLDRVRVGDTSVGAVLRIVHP